ncbi:hypothetical protein CR152_06595 [Massilia violaceinigra]|uniref:DUF2169 domain-containing protein n=1 Tax=Massilia violaceinigra TaxID=2045208 RepID=A0A2D2DGV2_9BURK|nr:DUF2169 domain-containing protein [Massilia violaceinigra]ATQ74204.1 hypothetical protein CR152_06595 [Massilia violaceinigra]
MNSLLTNQTPLPAIVKPYRDHLGQSHVLVIAKASWRISTDRMAPAEKQVPLHMEPVRLRIGDFELDTAQCEAVRQRLDQQVVWIDHDLMPPKPAFDVIVAGYATAPPKHAEMFIDAGIKIGENTGSIRAHTPRCWQKSWLGYRPRPLSPVVRRVPVSYAFSDWSEGFDIDPGKDGPDVVAYLPWIESLHASAKRRGHARAPAGLGYWPENAAHRRIHAGKYDDEWQKNVSPHLPKSFNPCFFNAAHPDLQLKSAPLPGTAIRLVHLAPQAILDCSFPHLNLSAQGRTAGGEMLVPVSLKPDTLTIEPDEDRFSIVWRALLPAGSAQSAVRTVRLFRS